jgi:hypothetical protein
VILGDNIFQDSIREGKTGTADKRKSTKIRGLMKSACICSSLYFPTNKKNIKTPIILLDIARKAIPGKQEQYRQAGV